MAKQQKSIAESERHYLNLNININSSSDSTVSAPINVYIEPSALLERGSSCEYTPGRKITKNGGKKRLLNKLTKFIPLIIRRALSD